MHAMNVLKVSSYQGCVPSGEKNLCEGNDGEETYPCKFKRVHRGVGAIRDVDLAWCACRPAGVTVAQIAQKGKEVLSNTGNECEFLLRADQREYRSRKSRKKEKKARKGRGEDEVSAAFKEAALSADAEQRRRTQSETLEALFEIFFRALKHCTASGLAAASHRGVLLPPASMLSGRMM